MPPPYRVKLPATTPGPPMKPLPQKTLEGVVIGNVLGLELDTPVPEVGSPVSVAFQLVR